ncbi:MAG: AsmA family protein, partial [Planctomycetota bacterium]
MSESATPSHESSSQQVRRRLGLRVALYVAALVPVLAGVSLWVVTRSWFIILMVAPELEQKLGGEVGIANASYRGDGVLVFENVTLSTGALEGQAAQVLHITRARISVDEGSFFGGGLRINDVELDGVLMRLSEDRRDPGEFNFSTLAPDWSDEGPSGPLLPPSVTIHDAMIELGQHDAQQYRLVGRRRVTGEMYPSHNDEGWYDVKLEELDNNGVRLGDAGLFIDGRWNVVSMEHRARIEGLTLDDRTFGMCPQIARLWWQRIMPEGPVGSAYIEWKKGEPFTAELSVDRMALNLPIDATEFSASYQQGRVETAASLPRMYVHSGTIRLHGNQLTLDNLVGVFGSSDQRQELVEMPYHVNFSIHDMPPFDWEEPQAWMDDVVATAPFEMSVRMNDFQLTQNAAVPEEAPAVELPRPVADTLAKFQLTGWSLNTQVDITREAPAVDDDGKRTAAPIKTSGTAHISDATGAFQGFPYPLDDVSAAVKFDHERIDLVYLKARGSDDAKLHMSGWIAPPGRDAAISLKLIAQNVPLDDRFRAALRGGQLDTYDIMLHEESYEKLLAAGLLPDDADVKGAAAARKTLVAELNGMGPAADDDPIAARQRMHLQREIERLTTIEDAKAFKLGGLIDLDLTIERPRGLDNKREITGSINVHRAGVVYGRFPYPIYVLGGTLAVEKNRVRVVRSEDGKGIPIATPGGGRGTVTGEVGLVKTDNGTRVKPALTVDLHGDYLSELLYAAMPLMKAVEPDEPGDPDQQGEQPQRKRSLVARILAGAGISGWLNHTGVITANDQGQPTFDFAVELYDARAEPNEELFDTMQELGLPSPKGITLDNVRALVQITPDTVRLVDFSGERGDARITADAQVDLASKPIDAELNVEFDDLALERYMIDLAPGAGAARAAELWDLYQPQGMYDAKITYHARGGEADSASLQVWPEELGVTVDGEPVWLICDRGEIVLHQNQVAFEDLLLRVSSATRDDGEIALDGSYGLASEERDMRVDGRWTGGQLASPLITETMRLIGAEEHADRYRGYAPSGTFDAEFFYDSPGGKRPKRYEFIIEPHNVGVTVNETPIFAELEPGAELMFTPGRIIFRNLA